MGTHWCTNCEGIGVRWCAFNPAVSSFADSAREQGVSYERSRWRRLLDPWTWGPRTRQVLRRWT